MERKMTIHTQPDRKARTFEVNTNTPGISVHLDADHELKHSEETTWCAVLVIEKGWLELDSKNKPKGK